LTAAKEEIIILFGPYFSIFFLRRRVRRGNRNMRFL